MFPSPQELKLQCSCPDYASMCKHVAATLFGVGYLLDTEPELFFKMRGVDQSELVTDVLTNQTSADAIGLDQQSDLAGEDLGAIFGIDLAASADARSTASTKTKSIIRARKRAALPKTKTEGTAKPTSKTPATKQVSRKDYMTAFVQNRRSKTSKVGETVTGAVTKKSATKKAVTQAKLKAQSIAAKKTTRQFDKSAAAPKAKRRAESKAKKPGATKAKQRV